VTGLALIMALINPLVLWDVGFQLSFFATLGIILYAEPFSNFTPRWSLTAPAFMRCGNQEITNLIHRIYW